MQSPHPMAASRGHGPRDGPFLLGVTCASPLLSSAVRITITASLYGFITPRIPHTPQRTHRNATGFARTA
eukprot:426351-Prymnesium_polylepis.1